MARRLAHALLAAALLTGVLAPSASAGFTVVQPTEKYAGKTYGQWSAAWWQWAANISEPSSPITDATGKNCGVNQKGAVWLLAGNAGGSTTRRCTVPQDKAVLFPVINAECSSVEGNGTTDAELRGCATSFMDQVTETAASVDGTPIELGTPPNQSHFRFQSPLFTITFAPNNGFGIPAGTGSSVADGYWVLLRPLAAGKHSVDFHANAPTLGFELSLHYALTVTQNR
jgi:hypothetical protein